MNNILKIANYVMAVAFLLGVLVQYNDPDPARWMAIYGAAVVACILFATGRKNWMIPAAVGVIALLWAIDWAPGVLGKTRPSEMFASWEMKNERVEEAREFWGLIIIASWMAVLSVINFRQAKR
ncbi:MAG: transmembrane 220 family protein [Acidobacteria bacterium]|nr:transmembrane 220 family protein [Acidobacteriota bacterium]